MLCKFPVGALHPFTPQLATGLVSGTFLFVSFIIFTAKLYVIAYEYGE
jgi:hypothetical protein